MLPFRLIRVVAGVALCLALVGGVGFFGETALARSARQSMLERNRAQRDKLYEKVKRLNESHRRLDDTVKQLDGSIDSMQVEMNHIQEQLVDAQRRLEELAAKQVELEAGLANSKRALAERARAIYMEGDLTYLDMLFQAASFSDLIDRAFFVQAVFERDERIILRTRTAKDELAREAEAKAAQIVEIGQIKQRYQQQLQALEAAKGDKELSMEAIDQDKKLALQQINEYEEENKRIAAEIREVARTSSGYKGRPWSGSFRKPVEGSIVSPFGMRLHPILHIYKMHTGVDIDALTGAPIHAAGDGKVIYTGWRGGYGKCVIVDHGGGRTTLYAHMSRITCDAGQIVNTKTKLGEVGATGFATGPHLHFEVRINGDPVDPLKSLD